MQLQDLQQLVQDQRRDQTSNFVDTDEINRYFNQLARNLNAEYEWDWAIVSGCVNYTSGSNQYALSALDSNFKEPINLFAGYNYQFEYTTSEAFPTYVAYNNNAWYVDSNYIYISNNTNVYPLSVTYYTNAAAITSGGSLITQLSSLTDSPLMPAEHQDIYVDYALMQIFRKEGSTEDYAISKQSYEDKVKRLLYGSTSRKARPLRSWGHITQHNSIVDQDKKSNPLG